MYSMMPAQLLVISYNYNGIEKAVFILSLSVFHVIQCIPKRKITKETHEAKLTQILFIETVNLSQAETFNSLIQWYLFTETISEMFCL